MKRQTLNVHSEIALEFFCPVCLKIPKNPVKCGNLTCQVIFCLSCVKIKIYPPNNRGYLCPYTCQGYQNFSIQQLNNTEYKFYDIFDIVCQYCQQKQNYFKYRKHEEKCYKRQQEMINLKQNMEHQKIHYQEQKSEFQSCQYCDYNQQQMEFCQYCHFIMKKPLISEDFIENLEYQICQICKQHVGYADQDYHKYNCLEAFVQCDICQINIQRKFYLDHYKTCTDKEINKLQQDNSYLLLTNNFYYLRLKQIQADSKNYYDRYRMISEKIQKYSQEQTDGEQ
ncbi:hypothetical protein pb186bvf_013595 [Paramecium bursaria]